MVTVRESFRRVASFAFVAHIATVFLGIAMSNIFFGLALLAAPWTRLERRLLDPAVRPLLFALLGVVLALLVAVAFSIDPRVSARALSEPLNLLTAVLTVLLASDPRRLRRLITVVIVVAVGLGLLGSLQLLVQGEAGLASRVRGTLSHYMTFSGILAIGGGFLVARLLFGRPRWWMWLTLIPVLVALLASLTRSAWIGLLVALVGLLTIRSPKLPFLAVPLLAIFFAVLAPDSVRARLVSVFDPTDPSNYDRLCMVGAGLEMAHDRPLTGVGPELVSRVYPIYRHPTAPRIAVPHLHNAPLQILAERGLVGLLAWVALLATGITAAWRRWRAEGGAAGADADIWLGAIAALVAFLVAGVFEDNWGDSEVRRLALVALAVPFCALAPGRGEPRGE